MDLLEETATEKHLAGSEHSHDQRTHGFRYGPISVSRARRMKQAGTFEEFKRRARDRQGAGAGGGESPEVLRPTPEAAARWETYQKEAQALTAGKLRSAREIGSSSTVFVGRLAGVSGSVIEKPVDDLAYTAEAEVMKYASPNKGADLEVAASDISASLGLDCVPVTALAGGNLRKKVVHGTDGLTYIDDGNPFEYEDAAARVVLVDYLVGQGDGHLANYVIDDRARKIYGVDYNMSGVRRASTTSNFRDAFHEIMGVTTSPWQIPIPVSLAKSLLAGGLGNLQFSASVPAALRAFIYSRFAYILKALEDAKIRGGYYLVDWHDTN